MVLRLAVRDVAVNAWDPSALAEEDIDEIVHSAEQPGGTRAILEMYRPPWPRPTSTSSRAAKPRVQPRDPVAEPLACHHEAETSPAPRLKADFTRPTWEKA